MSQLVCSEIPKIEWFRHLWNSIDSLQAELTLVRLWWACGTFHSLRFENNQCRLLISQRHLALRDFAVPFCSCKLRTKRHVHTWHGTFYAKTCYLSEPLVYRRISAFLLRDENTSFPERTHWIIDRMAGTKKFTAESPKRNNRPAGPNNKGGGSRGGPERWTGNGPAPARHIPWPEVIQVSILHERDHVTHLIPDL